MNWRPEFPHVGRAAAAVAVGMMLVMVLCLAIVGVVSGGGAADVGELRPPVHELPADASWMSFTCQPLPDRPIVIA